MISNYIRLKTLFRPLTLLDHLIKIIRIKFNCCCNLPIMFMLKGCMIPHPYAMTISADSIGYNCAFYQNITIAGTEKSKNKPKIGNVVCVFPGSRISGDITIGNNVIISANAVVTKNVPSNSIVYGVNVVKPLKPHHYKILEMQIWHCESVYFLQPGLKINLRKLTNSS